VCRRRSPAFVAALKEWLAAAGISESPVSSMNHDTLRANSLAHAEHIMANDEFSKVFVQILKIPLLVSSCAHQIMGSQAADQHVDV
jgi:hypothetical protein